MMTAISFLQALQHPSARLREALGGYGPELRTDGGEPEMRRLTEFLEATVTCGNARYRIAVPLHDEASRMAVRRAARLRMLDSPRISGFRLAEKALARFDALGEVCTEHLFVERIPEGRPLDEILAEGYPALRLHRELTALQAEFRRLGFSHGNLKPENLLLTPGGLLVAVRCYRTGFDGTSPEDDRAFEALHRQADREDNGTQLEAFEREVAEAERPAGNRPVPCSEGMLPIVRNGRYGFRDIEEGREIRPRFDEVTPFCEGRAVVGRGKRYGVIDRSGREVIPLVCKSVRYDTDRSQFVVRTDEAWYLKGYGGENLLGPCESREELDRMLGI